MPDAGAWRTNWAKICPRKQITTLDTHDGIGVVDVDGLLNQDDAADHLFDGELPFYKTFKLPPNILQCLKKRNEIYINA